jgi:putative membrane protein
MSEGVAWKKPAFNKVSDWLKTIGCGLCIGAADIVPGISGGTVAFIIGIYEDLLKSIATLNGKAFSLLIRAQFKAFFDHVSWKFLLAVIFGIVCSFITLAKFFTFLLNHEVYRSYLYSGFLGLILGSVFYCSKQISTWRVQHFAALFLASMIAFFLSGTDLIPQNHEPLYDVPLAQTVLTEKDKASLFTKPSLNFDQESKTLLAVPKSYLAGMVSKKFLLKDSLVYSRADNMSVKASDVISTVKTSYIDLWVVVCGAMAISAMLLPGISGSYLLTVLGMYGFILGSLVDFIEGIKNFTFDIDAFRVVFSMVLGIAIGAIAFSRAVMYLLNRFHDLALAALVGFMVGALRAVWPFWSYEYELQPLRLTDGPMIQVAEPFLPNSLSVEFVIALSFLAVGFATVLFIENFASKKQHKLEELKQ